MVQALQDSGILLKGDTNKIKNETRNKKGGYLSLLLGAIASSLLDNSLTGKETVRAGEGTIIAGEGI